MALLVAILGLEKGAVVTKRRGRWDSDIFFIYQRNDASDQLAASAIMIDASGRAVEDLIPQWVQPARRWGARG